MIKKLLGIVVLGLLLSSCATTDSIISSGKVKKNISKSELSDAFITSYPGEDPSIPGGGSEFFSEINFEIIWGSNKNKFYVFKNVSEPISCGIILCKYGNGTLETWHSSLKDARASLPKKLIKETQNSKSSQTNNSNTTSSNTTSATSSSASSSSSSTSSNTYNETKYLICYGEMTKAHKKRGFHQSNRLASIKVKETVCKAYAKGDIYSYEGKGG